MIAGRVSLAEGDAQIWRAEEDSDGEWDLAQINDVVTVGTGLYTGSNGRTEFRVGPNTYRLSAGSRGGFNQLDYGGAVFNLEHGSLNVSLAQPQQGEVSSVTVDGTRIDLAAPGRYRIDATENGGQARVTVFSGQGSVLSGGNAINVASGQALVVGPGLSSLNYEQASSTSFDQWALARDERYRNVQSARYVSTNMTGYEELDFHGEWIPDANYGNVWVPRAVPVGWAPYRNGQWRWVRPWGWTWVDQAPWGYAPFHYGRWVTIGNRWCWWPGGLLRASDMGARAGRLRRWQPHKRQFWWTCSRLVSARPVAPLSPALSAQQQVRDGHQSDDHQQSATRCATASQSRGRDDGAGAALPRPGDEGRIAGQNQCCGVANSGATA